MIYKDITYGDLFEYRKDLFKAFTDNKLIMDCQNPYKIDCEDDIVNFLAGYIESNDSMVIGIFDDREEFCYGYLIFDNVRCAENIMTTEMHMALAKEIWGKTGRSILSEIKENILFDIIYAYIPQIAVGAIAIAKRMGFKKTGYIPKALPYKKLNGEEKLYDLNILVLDKRNNK